MASSQTVATADAPPARPDSLVTIPFRQKLLVVAALSVTLFVATISQTVVATAAQNIVADIGGFDQFTWLFAGFSLTGAVAVPIVGKLSDIAGRKRVILASLGLFVVASGAAALAQTMTQLVLIRAVQGIGFAGAMGSIWIIMADLWLPADRAKWMGATAAGFTLSGVLGPVIGGVLSDAASWRWIFILNLPVGILALALISIWMPETARPRRRVDLDLAGAGAFVLFSSASLFALALGGEVVDWVSPVTGLLVFLTVAGLAAFILIERGARDPLIPLDLFKARVFSGAMVASLSITTSFIVVTAFLPLLIQGVKANSATVSAIPLMTMAVGAASGANVSGQLLSRFNRPRLGAIFGATTTATVLFYLSETGRETPIWAISLASLFLGFGMTFSWTSFTAPIQNAMPGRVLGVVTSTLQFARMFGMAAGAAAFGAILAVQLAASLGADLTGPAAAFEEPGLLVTDDRLAEVREEFLADPALGEAAYQSALLSARDSLADALSIIFKAAAAVSVLGIVFTLITFHRYRTYTEPAQSSPTTHPATRRQQQPSAPD